MWPVRFRIQENRFAQRIILSFVFFAVQFWLYGHYSVCFSTDSQFYLENAKFLAEHGELHNSAYIWYSGYIVPLAILLKAGIEVEWMILFQVLLSFISLILFYEILLKLKVSVVLAFLFTLFLASWYEIYSWNYFILTESLFISLNIILFYTILHFKHPLFENILLIILLLIWITWLRPNGFISLLAVAGYILWNGWSEFIPKRTSIILSGTAAVLVLLILLRIPENYEFINQYATGEVVYRASSVKDRFSVSSVILDVPPTLNLSSHTNKILGLIHFIWQNPMFFFSLFFSKIFYFLTHVKPYYSSGHNIWILATLLPAYIFAIIGFVKAIIRTSVIVLNTVLIGFAIEDWDGRFLMPVLPFVFILAALGFDHMYNWNVGMNWKFLKSKDPKSRFVNDNYPTAQLSHTPTHQLSNSPNPQIITP